MLVNVEENTFLGAVQQLSKMVRQEVFFGHLRLFVFSEAVATEDWRLLTDELMRNADLNRLTQLALAKGVNARELMSINPPLSPTLSAFIIGIMQKNGTPPVANLTALWEFYRDTITPGREAGVLGVGIESGQLSIYGSALFRDGRLVGWLDNTETVGFTILKNDLNRATFETGDSDDPWVFRNVTAKADMKARITDGKLVLALDIRADASLGKKPQKEVSNNTLLLTNQAGRELQQELKTIVAAALARMQLFGADIADLGRQVRFQMPAEWRINKWDTNWPAAFSAAELEVKVTVIVRRKGLLR